MSSSPLDMEDGDGDHHTPSNHLDDIVPRDELPIPEPPVQENVEVRRSTRDQQPSRTYSPHEYLLLTNGGEPKSYEEAISDESKNEWFKAMQEEMKPLNENHTYERVKFPKGKRALKEQMGVQAEDK